MATHIVKYGQSIYDIAVEVYGSVMGVSQILIDNPTIDLQTHLLEDSTLEIFPSSETILDTNISAYFQNKTISNSEILSDVDALEGAVSYGELITKNANGLTHINSNMWGNNSINLSNTGLDLNEFNFDRILLSPAIKLEEHGDFFEIDFTYNDLGIDQYLFGSSDGSSVRIIDNKISLYFSGGNPILTNFTELIDLAKYRLKIETIVSEVDGIESKSFGISIDGYLGVKGDHLGKLELNLVGGEDGSYGYEGTISYLNINGNVFNFIKENGIYIYKSR